MCWHKFVVLDYMLWECILLIIYIHIHVIYKQVYVFCSGRTWLYSAYLFCMNSSISASLCSQFPSCISGSLLTHLMVITSIFNFFLIVHFIHFIRYTALFMCCHLWNDLLALCWSTGTVILVVLELTPLPTNHWNIVVPNYL